MPLICCSTPCDARPALWDFPSEVRDILKDIVHDDNRAGEVIRRLRTMVRTERLEFAPLVLANLIDDVVLLLRSGAILHNVRVLIEINAEIPLVRGDRV
jgi:two-component system, LuxR family, sensor kinase FixL